MADDPTAARLQRVRDRRNPAVRLNKPNAAALTECIDCLKRQKVYGLSSPCTRCAALRSKNSPKNTHSNLPNSENVKALIRRNAQDSPLIAIDSQSVERTQMFSDFFETHLPSASTPEIQYARRASYLRSLMHTNTSSLLLRNALNVLCYAHVGTAHHDQSLLRASQVSYGRVLALLRQALQAPHSNSTRREVVASILLLSHLDDGRMQLGGDQANGDPPSSWMTHLWGASEYLAACSPTNFDSDHPLDVSMIRNIHMNAFWLALARRKALRLATPRWASAKTLAWQTYNHVYRDIPALLESADDLLAHQQRLSAAMPFSYPPHPPHLMPQLLNLCHELQQVRDTGSHKFAGAIVPDIVHTKNLAEFSMDIEEHAFITSSRTFTAFYNFPSATPGFGFAHLELMLLLIDCTLLRIIHFHPIVAAALSGNIPGVAPPASFSGRRTPDDIQRDALQSAKQLCRGIYYFSKFSSLATARYVRLILQVVHEFFEQVRAYDEMVWCETCLIATNLRIDRMQLDAPETLCRVGDLAPGFQAGVRFRHLVRVDVRNSEIVVTPEPSPSPSMMPSLPERISRCPMHEGRVLEELEVS